MTFPVEMVLTAIHPIIRPLYLAAFSAFVRAFNQSKGVCDMDAYRDAPSGVSLHDVLTARMTLSILETVHGVMCDAADAQLDIAQANNIANRFGSNACHYARARAIALGAPTRESIARALTELRAHYANVGNTPAPVASSATPGGNHSLDVEASARRMSSAWSTPSFGCTPNSVIDVNPSGMVRGSPDDAGEG